MPKYSFNDFYEIIQKLRSKDGCPWDREQTHDSLKTCLIEECYETIEAIDNQDMKNLCEELGDILLQVVMHSVIAQENHEFTLDDVISEVSEKMIRRHPHVFGDVTVHNSEDVVTNWEKIKQVEKKEGTIADEIIRVPKALPANIRAEKVQKKAAKAGMDFENQEQVFSKINEELNELQDAIKIGDKSIINEEFGDVLFSVINLSRFLQLNAENSLTNATNKFINRFVDVFSLAERRGQNLCDMTPAEQEVLWREIK
ncbi:nucleoside triphosphate pyrophosphohydrolase [Mobilitalea sibirica]|uniref:Nucleoside triphosphate pyrophosphohydrolase n=1 Tax=Mobilitalea sibirica TaxID=1462919 RepID=A0A8J7L2J3_9FIRM|nr:nucleoside triphosphate pyrophosphohydrolase [Mobilitalea sibirica]MBH1940733.1 nucleoside triphosphate pyrophosphohydrolase [Mobilitalea sibirica]